MQSSGPIRDGMECSIVVNIKWASTRENLTLVYVNNKGADQPAHSRRLISAFVIPF